MNGMPSLEAFDVLSMPTWTVESLTLVSTSHDKDWIGYMLLSKHSAQHLMKLLPVQILLNVLRDFKSS
jgi:hypothetical protein